MDLIMEGKIIMPTYDYVCNSCMVSWEEFHSISNRKEPCGNPCPFCMEDKVEMRIGSPAIIDPTKLSGHTQVNSQLREKFQQIHENTHGSRLDQASTITKI